MASRLPFAMAVAAGRALSSLDLDPPLAFKWPNDLRADRAKLGGILVETLQASGIFWAVCGIGLNVAAAPQVTEQRTTCLHALGAPIGLDAQTVLEGLHASVAQTVFLAVTDFEAVLDL